MNSPVEHTLKNLLLYKGPSTNSKKVTLYTCLFAGNSPLVSPEGQPDLLESWGPGQKWPDEPAESASQSSCLGGHFFDQVAELEKLIPVEATGGLSSWDANLAYSELGVESCRSDVTDPLCSYRGITSTDGGFEEGSLCTSHYSSKNSMSCAFLASNPLASGTAEDRTTVGESCLFENFWHSDKIEEDAAIDCKLNSSSPASVGSTSSEERVLEKRKRNNEASRKFRHKKKSKHRSLFARAEQLERDNSALKLQVEELLRETNGLKTILSSSNIQQ